MLLCHSACAGEAPRPIMQGNQATLVSAHSNHRKVLSAATIIEAWISSIHCVDDQNRPAGWLSCTVHRLSESGVSYQSLPYEVLTLHTACIRSTLHFLHRKQTGLALASMYYTEYHSSSKNERPSNSENLALFMTLICTAANFWSNHAHPICLDDHTSYITVSKFKDGRFRPWTQSWLRTGLRSLQ